MAPNSQSSEAPTYNVMNMNILNQAARLMKKQWTEDRQECTEYAVYIQ